MDICKLSATEMAACLRSHELSATEIAKASLERIQKVEGTVDAFLTVTEDEALAAAAKVDAQIAAGEQLAPLAGIPVGIKDNICTKGVRTTCASRMLENFVPPYDATVIEKLKAQGAVLTGKTNMDEFAMGSSCENSYFKPTRNPWDITRVPGGSSGGSAAAVAACEVPLSLGSDTGGSVRCPASFCGVVGLKPTYGAVSRYGLVAFASSLDQIGPFGRTVDDVSLLFDAISGEDKTHDATSKAGNFAARIREVKGLRIGLPKEYFGEGISEEVRAAVLKAVEEYRAMGAEIIEVSLPSTPYALSAYYIIASAEASSNLGRYDGVKYGFCGDRGGSLTDMYETTRSEGFGDEVQRRIMLGTYVLSSGYYDAYYKRAKLLQQNIAKEFEEAFTKCDFMITPVNPTTAFKLGENVNDPVAMYMADVCTINVNIAGLPGLSIPCGLGKGNLPIGLQMIGPKWSEGVLLGAAKCYETAVGGFAVKEM